MKITAIETIRVGRVPELALGAGAHRRRAGRPGRDLLRPRRSSAYIHESVAPYLLGKDPLRSTGISRVLLNPISASAAPAWRCAAPPRSTSRCGTSSARRPASRSTSCSAALSRDRIRIYNTCAGYRYVRSQPTADSRQLGPAAATPTAPTRTSTPSCTAPTSWPRACCEQGITGMKIWPFDPAAEAIGRHLHLRPPISKRRWSRSARSARPSATRWTSWSSSTRCGTCPPPMRIAAGAGAVRPVLVRRPDQDGQPRRAGRLTRARRRVPVTASETLATRWAFRELLEPQRRRHRHARPELGRRHLRGQEDRHHGRGAPAAGRAA